MRFLLSSFTPVSATIKNLDAHPLWYHRRWAKQKISSFYSLILKHPHPIYGKHSIWENYMRCRNHTTKKIKTKFMLLHKKEVYEERYSFNFHIFESAKGHLKSAFWLKLELNSVNFPSNFLFTYKIKTKKIMIKIWSCWIFQPQDMSWRDFIFANKFLSKNTCLITFTFQNLTQNETSCRTLLQGGCQIQYIHKLINLN